MLSVNLFMEHDEKPNIKVGENKDKEGQTYYNLRINDITIYDVNLIKDKLIEELNKIVED